MKAKLTNDWGPHTIGTVTLTTETGKPLAKVAFLSINPEIINIREYRQEMHMLASAMIESINEEKSYVKESLRWSSLLLQAMWGRFR